MRRAVFSILILLASVGLCAGGPGYSSSFFYTLSAGTITSSGAITGSNFVSTVATGTAPFASTSTTLCTNLNADSLDGHDAAYFTDIVIGNEVTDTNGATLTRSGTGTAGDPYKLALNLGNANTWTAAQANSYTPTASTPAYHFTGAIMSGGTGTTNFPNVLIQPTGATAASDWSTSGTAFGVNLNEAAGNFIDLKYDGVSKFRISSAGTVYAVGDSAHNFGQQAVSAGGFSSVGSNYALQSTASAPVQFYAANHMGIIRCAGLTAGTYVTGLDLGTTDGVIAATDGGTGAGAFGVPLTSDSVANIQVGMVVMADDNVDNAFKICTADSTLPIGLYTGIGASAASTAYAVATDGIAYAAPDEGVTPITRGEVAFVDASLAGYIDTDAALQAAGKNIGRVMRSEVANVIVSIEADDDKVLLTDAIPADWAVGDPVIYWDGGGADITELTTGNVYWIQAMSAQDKTDKKLTLTATKGGAVINIADDRTGTTHYLMRLPKVLIRWN